MLYSVNYSYSILYILFAWFLGMCYGFVLLSSAAGQSGEINLFLPGESVTYQWQSNVLLNEKDDSSKNVGFFVAGEVVVQALWGSTYERILKIEIKSPQLHIKSRKAPAPDGFVPHSSKLERYSNQPFLIVWNRGKIDKILLPKNEETSLTNVKKGVASLFQFQLLDGTAKETDASGLCEVTYLSLSPSKLEKTKSSCLSNDFPYVRNPDKVLGTTVSSSRKTEYGFDFMSNVIKTVISEETHQMYLPVKEEIGSFIKAEQFLTFIKTEETSSLQGDNVEDVLEQLLRQENVQYTQESLATDKEQIDADDSNSFTNLVNELRNNLGASHLGTILPAKTFLRLVSQGRKTRKEDIAKALGSNKNKVILAQLYDILGFVQTQDSHDAVMKKLHLDKDEHVDFSERYLWALSLSSQQNRLIIKDLLKRYKKNGNLPEKVKETLILTISSMTYRLRQLSENSSTYQNIAQEVQEVISNELDYAKGEARFVFLRALRNLRSESSIPLLLNIIKIGTTKEAVLAWKALKSLHPESWNEDVIKSARKTFFQLDKKYDSSSRTLALDILLESKPSDKALSELIYHLASNDTTYEIKQYVNQRLKMTAEDDEEFKDRVLNILKNNPRLNNYSTLSPRGLSIALKRKFFRTSSSSGSLVSIQEMNSGIVKRGLVNVVMDVNGTSNSNELFGLGIFSGGLNSFVSSESEDNEEEETATAGMEVTVLGSQIRPFVFFNGQGELMGHVWAGTASEKTPAYQALAMLQDHLEYLRLGSGFIAELEVKGAASIDLSGKIEISLWNRNAESFVGQSAGIITTGVIKVDTSFVTSQVEFAVSIEPKLNIQTDIDFSGNVNLCMRVSQPENLFRHNIFKIERIAGSKHKLRIAKYKKYTVPGKTYSLNRKNNEMCSAIFT